MIRLRDEISPKNILMIGPTGVGKTEIARRIAKLVNAPFIKVEATKFTEVDMLVEMSNRWLVILLKQLLRLVKEEKNESVRNEQKKMQINGLVELLVPSSKKTINIKNPLEMFFGGGK